MAKAQVFNLRNLNTGKNPMLLDDGELIQAVNVDSTPFGAKTKRPGLTQYLGTLSAQRAESLFSFAQGTNTSSAYTFWNYIQENSVLFYSVNGTGVWTVVGNGTFPTTGPLMSSVLADTLIVGDPEGTVRHTANGTSLTNTSGPPAPGAMAEYHQRIYIGGYYSSNLFWSNVGTASDWTNDSSSILIPGPGRIRSLYKSIDDKLMIGKETGELYSWDEVNLEKVSKENGPSSRRSLAVADDKYYYLNWKGVYRQDIGLPTQISAPVENYINDRSGSAIPAAHFGTAQGGAYGDKYYCTIGSATPDSVLGSSSVLVYDTRMNDWSLYSSQITFNSYLSFVNSVGSNQFVVGNSTAGTHAGIAYTFNGTQTSDANFPIYSVIEAVFHAKTLQEKKWNYLWALFNPGCEANIQIATANSFREADKNWLDIGDTKTGVVEFKFPEGSRSRFLFIKVTDSTTTIPFIWYGYEVDFDFVDRK